MIFYLIQFLLLFIFSYTYVNESNVKVERLSKIIIFSILFLPAAFRYGIGTDYFAYVNHYYKVLNGISLNTEPLWNFLIKMLVNLKLTPQFIFIISSFITLSFICKNEKNDSFIVLITYYLYLYLASYNAVRNGVSLVLIWYAYQCLLKNEKSKFYIFYIFSFLFHYSAIVYLPIFMLGEKIKFSKKNIAIFCVILVFVVSYLNIFELIFKLPILHSLRWGKYFSDHFYNSQTVINSGLGVKLRYLILFCIFFLICPENSEEEKECNFIYLFFIFYLGADMLSLQVKIFTRLKIEMYLFYISSMKFLWKKRDYIHVQIFIFIFYIYSFICVFLIPLLNNENEVIPYKLVSIF